MLSGRVPSPSLEVFDHGRAERRALDEVLRFLSTRDCAPHRVASLYLDTRWRDEHQRVRVSLSVRDQARTLGARYSTDQALAADLALALAFTEERVQQAADVGYAGVALFRCGPADLDLALRCHARFPTSLTAASVPLVRPLAAAAITPHAFLAVADSTEVRLFEYALDDLQGQLDVAGGVPRQHSSGGWAQLKLDHFRDVQIDALHRDAAEALARLFDAAGPTPVLLGGISEAVANLRRHLPDRVAAEAHALPGLRADAPEHEVLALASEALAELEREEALRALEAIRSLAASPRRGALGLKDVVDALNDGRVMRVLIAESLADRILPSCAGCGRIVTATEARACDACGGALLQVDAAEAVTRAAIPQAARVELVPGELLARDGWVAAALRY